VGVVFGTGEGGTTPKNVFDLFSIIDAGSPSAPSAPTTSQISAGTVASAPTGGQGLALAANGSVPVGNVQVGSATATTINAKGQSTFLQLISVAKSKISLGSGTVTFAANAQADSVVTHSLGTTPLWVAVLGTADTINSLYPMCYSVGATTFSARLISTGGNVTGVVTFYWAAIG